MMELPEDTKYLSEFNYKIINDSIYGCISLSETEVRLLDTKAMQRLRRIRQLGFTSYVFPNGEHSRFVHSLGVLCIVGRMCDQLYRNYGHGADGEIRFTLEDTRLVRTAALLHDVGHFPFSHLSEYVYSCVEDIAAVQEKAADANLLCVIANFKRKRENDHEHLGAEVIRKDPEITEILRQAGIDPEAVVAIVKGDMGAKPIHAQLLHASLDADKLDYLIRDSRQAGVSFGNVELDYILRQMRIVRCPILNQNGSEALTEMIAFDSRGKHAIEHFLMGRYFHYTQIILHKTSLAFEAVAKALIFKVLMENRSEPFASYAGIVNVIGTESFYRLTDDFLWQLIAETEAKSSDDTLKTFWSALSRRKNIVHVLSLSDIVPKAASAGKSAYVLTKWLMCSALSRLSESADIPPAYIGYVESKISIEAIPSHLQAEDCTRHTLSSDIRGAIRLIDEDGRIFFLASDSASLISRLVDYSYNSLHIFAVGDIPDANIKRLKRIIKQKTQG